MKEEVYHQMARIEAEHWWFEARRRIVAHCLDGLRLPPNAEILEIGCGTGGNFAMLSGFGRLSALDNDPHALGYAAKHGNSDLREGSLPNDVPFPEASFDLIVLLDVLEHVEQDRESLRSIYRFLKPGGHLVLTVPAFAFLWSPHDELHEHQRRYTRSELRQKVGEAGYGIRFLTYFNSILFPPIAAIRVLQKVLPHRPKAALNVPPRPLNWLLTGLFASERRLFPRIPYPAGVSLLLHCVRE